MVDAGIAARFLDDLDRGFPAGDPRAADKEAEAGNVRALRDMYAAVGRRDLAAALAALADDVTFEIAGPPGRPFVARADGRAAVGAALGHNFGLVAARRIDVRAVVAQGDTVVVAAREVGTWVPAGDGYDIQWVHQFVFEGGKVRAVREVIGHTGPPAGGRREGTA